MKDLLLNNLDYVAIYLLGINLIGFFVMLVDKIKAKNGSWRIKEGTIYIISMLGGSIGTIAGMYAFRHKTKKLKFTVGLPVILITEIVLIVYLWINY